MPTVTAAADNTNGHINVSWGIVTGATGYTVSRGTSGSGPFTAVSTNQTAATYTDSTGLTAGTVYYYVVSASNAGGTCASANSTPAASARSCTLPSVPSNVKATAGISRVTVSWTASTDNVGVTGYLVYRNGTLVGSPTTTSFTDTGLTDGHFLRRLGRQQRADLLLRGGCPERWWQLQLGELGCLVDSAAELYRVVGQCGERRPSASDRQPRRNLLRHLRSHHELGLFEHRWPVNHDQWWSFGLFGGSDPRGKDAGLRRDRRERRHLRRGPGLLGGVDVGQQLFDSFWRPGFLASRRNVPGRRVAARDLLPPAPGAFPSLQSPTTASAAAADDLRERARTIRTRAIHGEAASMAGP